MDWERRFAASKRRRQVQVRMMVLALFAAVVLAFCGFRFVYAHDEPDKDPSVCTCYKSIEIASGDTLWSIAEEYADDSYENSQHYIAEVKKINHLESDVIHQGQFLTVPYNKV